MKKYYLCFTFLILFGCKDSENVVSPNYKEYVALLTQTGLNPPEAVVLSNDFNDSFHFSYFGRGQYYFISPSSHFKSNKTTILLYVGLSEPARAFLQQPDSVIAIYTYNFNRTASDDVLQNATFIVRVYK